MNKRNFFDKAIFLLKQSLIIDAIAILILLGLWWVLLPHTWQYLGCILALGGAILIFVSFSVPTGVSMASDRTSTAARTSFTHHSFLRGFYRFGDQVEVSTHHKPGKEIRAVDFLGVTQVIVAGLILIILGIAMTYITPA